MNNNQSLELRPVRRRAGRQDREKAEPPPALFRIGGTVIRDPRKVRAHEKALRDEPSSSNSESPEKECNTEAAAERTEPGTPVERLTIRFPDHDVAEIVE